MSAASSRLIPIDVARLTAKRWDWSNCLILFVRSLDVFGLDFSEEIRLFFRDAWNDRDCCTERFKLVMCVNLVGFRRCVASELLPDLL